jgi:serine/threonine-protein kinase RsbW
VIVEIYTFSFPNTARAYGISAEILNPVVNSLAAGAPEKQRLKLIVSELVMNAYIHGNRGDPRKTIDVIIQFDENQFVTVVKDQGRGFKEEDYRRMVTAVSGEGDESGRGMKIVHKLCDQVQLYKDEDDKFCIRVTRRMKLQPAAIKPDAGRS